MTIIDDIGCALDMTGHIVHGIRDGQWDNPTPCTDWTVSDVLDHTVGGIRTFAAELTNTAARADHDSDLLGADAVAAYDLAARTDRDAWSDPTALNGTITISLGTLPAPTAAAIHLTEIVVHGVDIAVAAGQTNRIDEELCTALLALMADMGGVDPYRQPGIFGPAIDTPRHQVPHIRLMNFLGRRVMANDPTQRSAPRGA